METYVLTALQPDPVVAYYYLKFWRECVSKEVDHLYLFWSAGKKVRERLKDCVWLDEVRNYFYKEFAAEPKVRWYEEGFGDLEKVKGSGGFTTHFDALDYMFLDVPNGSITVSYDSDVFWWDRKRLKFYIDLVKQGKVDFVGSVPSGCGTQIHQAISTRQPPDNVHPSFVVIETDKMREVRPQPDKNAFGAPVRWAPYTWEPGSFADQVGVKITETTHVDVFGWATLELIDRLGYDRLWEIKDQPRYQEVYDSFIGEGGWCHLAATSSLMYVWRTLFPGLENDIPKWTRGRTLFGVARMLLGLNRLADNDKFMELEHAKDCIFEAQKGLEFMCEEKGIEQKDIREMTDRIKQHYPL